MSSEEATRENRWPGFGAGEKMSSGPAPLRVSGSVATTIVPLRQAPVCVLKPKQGLWK